MKTAREKETVKIFEKKYEEEYDKDELKLVKDMYKKYNKTSLDKDLEEWVIKQLEKGKESITILSLLGITNLK